MKPVLTVVAALLWQDYRFLACRRPPHKAQGGLWEFVGGKVEQGEGEPAALCRECNEELGVKVTVGQRFATLRHEYEDRIVCLSLYEGRITDGRPQLLEHSALRWVTPRQAMEMDFCPADTPILQMLCTEKGLLSALRVAAEPSFAAFQQRLLPEVAPARILGIRMPRLRRMAGQLYNDGIKSLANPDALLEVCLLNGLLCAQATDFAAALAAIEQYLPQVDNWMACDLPCPPLAQDSQRLLPHLYQWMDSGKPYFVRYAIVQLLRYYTEDDFSPKQAARVAKADCTQYAVSMAVAWYFAALAVHHWDAALAYLKAPRLSAPTRRRAIQKCCDSRRLSPAQKQALRALRQKG